MAEYNRLVGVDAEANLPEPVRRKLFSSTESNNFKNGVVQIVTPQITNAVNGVNAKIAEIEPRVNSRIQAVSSEINRAKTDINNNIQNVIEPRLKSSIASVHSGLDAAKTDLNGKITAAENRVNGRVDSLNKTVEANKQAVTAELGKMLRDPGVGSSGAVLTYESGTARWKQPETELPAGGNAGQMLTKSDAGLAWSDVPALKSEWSKDQQAKAQGFWIEYSVEEPKKPTYTTADGVTVPVIWHRPVETLIPMVPQRPYFYTDTTSVGINEYVGCYFTVESITKDGRTTPVNKMLQNGENDLSGIGQLPFTVRIRAHAKRGYKLPSEFYWDMYYYDKTAKTRFGSEDFEGRANGSHIYNTQFGNTGRYFKGWDRGDIAYPLPSDHELVNKNLRQDNQTGSAGFTVESGQLVIRPKPSWQYVGVKTLSKYQVVSFEIKELPTDPDISFILSGADNSEIHGVSFQFMRLGIRKSLAGNQHETMFNGLPPLGVYTLEALSDRVALTAPDGTRYATTRGETNDRGEYGSMFGIRYNRTAEPTGKYRIDNLVIDNYGV